MQSNNPDERLSSLQKQLTDLEQQQSAIEEKNQAVEDQARALEVDIRELATQEANLQQRKKEIQARAKQIGKARSGFIKQQKSLDGQRQALRKTLAHTEQQIERDTAEESRLRDELKAQDDSWRAFQEERETAEIEERKKREAEEVAQRNLPRIAMAVDVSMQTENNFFMGLTENLSEGGLFIATHDALPLGTKLDLILKLPETSPIQAKVEVRWVREYNQFTKDMAPGVGVQFQDLGEADQKVISSFLAQRDPILYDAF
jgi:uncharacterized protein (TIGR02266 family)